MVVAYTCSSSIPVCLGWSWFQDQVINRGSPKFGSLLRGPGLWTRPVQAHSFEHPSCKTINTRRWHGRLGLGRGSRWCVCVREGGCESMRSHATHASQSDQRECLTGVLMRFSQRRGGEGKKSARNSRGIWRCDGTPTPTPIIPYNPGCSFHCALPPRGSFSLDFTGPNCIDHS